MHCVSGGAGSAEENTGVNLLAAFPQMSMAQIVFVFHCCFFARLLTPPSPLPHCPTMYRHSPPDPTEPGAQGAYIIMGRAAGLANMCAANLSGHDEFGLPYSIAVVLECKNNTSLSSARGTSRVLEKV